MPMPRWQRQVGELGGSVRADVPDVCPSPGNQHCSRELGSQSLPKPGFTTTALLSKPALCESPSPTLS